MTNRARLAARTTQRIADATEALLAGGVLEAVTLQAIAREAGVTVQTVLRHMGSRDGCLRTVAKGVEARVRRQREASVPGDVAGAIAGLLAHYETDGRLMLNLLAREGRGDPFAVEAAGRGRAYHRAWVERCFGPRLPDRSDASVDALVAATDLYAWKLLRLDLGRSPGEVEAVIVRLVDAVPEDA